MTVAEILEQAKALSLEERKELTKQLIDSFGETTSQQRSKTGAEIVALLKDSSPVEFVDEHIEDPVEWVQAQRQKQADRLKPYMGNEND